MTAQGEGLLAWLDTVIARSEYRTPNARVAVLREVMDRLKTEALRTDSEPRYQALVWVACLLDEMAAEEQTSPSKGDRLT